MSTVLLGRGKLESIRSPGKNGSKVSIFVLKKFLPKKGGGYYYSNFTDVIFELSLLTDQAGQYKIWYNVLS